MYQDTELDLVYFRECFFGCCISKFRALTVEEAIACNYLHPYQENTSV
jgi:hypothetical protein